MAMDINGTPGNDLALNGTADSDTIRGFAGFDSLYGKEGDDFLYGDEDNDFLEGGLGNDYIDGGAGTDVVTYFDANVGVTVNLGIETPQDTGHGIDTLINVEWLTGTYLNDTLTGSARGERFDPRAGFDVVNMMGGDDELMASYGSGTYDGGAGSDLIWYAFSSAVTVDLAILTAQTVALGRTQTLSGFENLYGSDNGDTLKGDDAVNQILGLGGNDIVEGRGGNDQLRGDAGNDQVDGGAGDDIVWGDDGYSNIGNPVGDDHLFGGDGNDELNGGGGTDHLEGGAGDDLLRIAGAGSILDGGEGFDTAGFGHLGIANWSPTATGITIDMMNPSLSTSWAKDTTFVSIERVFGTVGADRISGTDAAEQLDGLAGNDRLFGRGGNDRLVGWDGDDRLDGGDGDDTLIGDTGNDRLDGGAGTDRLEGGFQDDVYVVDADDTVVEFAGQGYDAVYARGDFTLAASLSIEMLGAANYLLTAPVTLRGNELNNAVTGNNGHNNLYGGAGDDYLTGLEGDDRFEGGAGVDFMVGGLGNDIYFVDNPGDEVRDAAGEGYDYLYTSTSYVLRAGVEIELFATIDYLATTALALNGNALNNAITANNGDNSLIGAAGDDFLTGLAGNDFLEGGTGSDIAVGGLGDDRYVVDSMSDVVREAAGEGYDRVYASASYTLAEGSEVEFLATDNPGNSFGGNYDFTLTGNGINNVVIGNAGANILRGLGGDDSLSGLLGADVLEGGAGRDLLSGGAGADTFRFTATTDSVSGAEDRITDFVSGTDKIDLSAIDAKAGTAADDSFAMIGTNVFSGTSGELRYQVYGGETHIYGDVNGDAVADFAIIVIGTVNPADFIF
jgi:Ca2+-binding RTX toxin-like protein